MDSKKPQAKKDFIEKGFELDTHFNKVFIAIGAGAAAVGSVIAAPAVVMFGAATVGGSIVELAVTDRLKSGYENMKTKRAASKLGKNVTKDQFTLAA